MRSEMATKTDVADLRSAMTSLRADVAADVIDMLKEIVGVRKDLGEQIVGLRRAVVEYHTSVIGHGIIISDLEARLRRVEQHLDLSGTDGHWSPAARASTRVPSHPGCTRRKRA